MEGFDRKNYSGGKFFKEGNYVRKYDTQFCISKLETSQLMSLEGHEQDDCLCQKQLFGRIEVVKAKNNFLVTAHFGIAFDAGCISVRKINSPVDLPVIFSIYEVIYI